MKREAHVEEQYTCDQCSKKLSGGSWYRIHSDTYHDFCSDKCATTFRDRYYNIVRHERYPRIIGNTD